jgi:4-hydroxybenzoate polyprenyltransferase
MNHFIRLMRLDKPIGTLLVLWPVLWALWLANNGIPTLKLLIIFILGALTMRTAGCVVNDIFDRKLDQHVARTAQRPLAQNKLSVKQAWITFFILMFLAFLLVLQLNLLTLGLAFCAAGLTVLYPLCKRVTYLPQLILGFTFNFGVLMAYSASLNQLPLMAWLLFFVSVIWTVAYDTLYAMADKPDDIKIGIKSTAILFGHYEVLIINLLYVVFFVGLLGIGLIHHLGAIFVFFVTLSATWTFYPSKTPFKAFLANNITGLLIFLGFFAALY